MYYQSYALFLAAAIPILPILGFPLSADDTVVGKAATALKPINVLDFEAATGIQRRVAEDFSNLNLSTQAQLIYGRPGADGQLLLANMTLYAPNGLQMVMMERFEPMTTAVDCNGDDGLMSLTFKSQDAFKHALDTWSFINQAEEKKFLLIANHDGCGPQDERQPYLITNIQEDEGKLTTFLTAEKAPWSDIAGTYDLDFGRAIQPKKASRRRGLLDRITNAVSNTGDFILNGNADFSSFQVTGHLSVKDFSLQGLTLAGSPQGFAAKMDVGTSITAPYSPNSLQYSKELYSAPIPEAGISVTGIFSLGAVVSYEVGVSTTFSGSASMNFGLTASLPDTAIVIADGVTRSASTATGFEGASFDPHFNLTAFSAGVTLAAFSQAKLTFGVDITKVGKLEVGMALKLPGIEAIVKAAYNEAGLCSTTPGASKTGAQINTNIFVAVDLTADAELGEDEDTTPTLALRLFKSALPISSSCFPIDIPGLTANSTETLAAATLPTEPLPTTVVEAAALPAATVDAGATTTTAAVVTSVPVRRRSNARRAL
ncbi:MAG: hypothetical protein Q9206_004819 [Seirophora lacunosa]|nr:MAG: hypothetical protein LQ344_006126 [Seirophora lacunosa]